MKSDSLTEHLKKGCSEEDIVYQRRSEKNSETYVWMEVKDLWMKMRKLLLLHSIMQKLFLTQL